MSEPFTILGILGQAGSGKDTVADWLQSQQGFVKIAFADPMKRFVNKTFGVFTQSLWGPSEERNKIFYVSEDWWYAAIGKLGDAANEILNKVLLPTDKVRGYVALMDWFNELRKNNRERISTRIILQTLGTEWGRTVDPLMWVRYAHQVIVELKEQGLMYNQEEGIVTGWSGIPYVGAVIPDHRFANEIAYTREKGGYVIRVRRLAQEEKKEVVGMAGHTSEAEQKALPDEMFDVVLECEEGVDKVHERLQKAYVNREWEKNSPLRL